MSSAHSGSVSSPILVNHSSQNLPRMSSSLSTVTTTSHSLSKYVYGWSESPACECYKWFIYSERLWKEPIKWGGRVLHMAILQGYLLVNVAVEFQQRGLQLVAVTVALLYCASVGGGHIHDANREKQKGSIICIL